MTEPDLTTALHGVESRLAETNQRLDDDAKKRSREWRFAAAAAALVVVIGGLGWRSNDDRISDIVNARVESRHAICSGFEAFTNALIASGGTPKDPAALQAKVTAFKADLESRLGPLDCHLNLVIPGG